MHGESLNYNKNFLRPFRFNVTADLNMMSVLLQVKTDEAVHGSKAKNVHWSIIHFIILSSYLQWSLQRFFNSFLFYVDDLDNLDFSIGFLLQTIYAIYSSMQFSSKFLFCPDFIENKICKHFLNFTLAVALLIEQICMTSIWS